MEGAEASSCAARTTAKRVRNGRSAARDIVQFVPLRKTHASGGIQAVARELLAEIPGQVVGYFHGLRGIPPPHPAAPTGKAAGGKAVDGGGASLV